MTTDAHAPRSRRTAATLEALVEGVESTWEAYRSPSVRRLDLALRALQGVRAALFALRTARARIPDDPVTVYLVVVRPSAAEEQALPIVVGITGATGAIYGIRTLQALRAAGVESHVITTKWAERTIVAETAWKPQDVRALADHAYDETDVGAPLATSSFLTRGMIVAPCSMKSLAAIANGISENLIHQAAQVHMKQRRKLLLLARESPLSVIHLENMLRVAREGVVVMPPVPAFYARPTSLEDVVAHTVGRVLDQFAVPHSLVRRWGDKSSG